MGILTRLLSVLSGNKGYKVSDQLLFDKVIGFRGLSGGVGTSTLVQNVAVALANNSSYSIVVVDASFLTPTQDLMLGVEKRASKDFIHYRGELSEIVSKTSHKSISVVSLNQDVAKMFSSEDNAEVVYKLISSLKSHFDVILIDLPLELTTISAELCIKCNRIISVADESVKCVSNIKRTLNNLGTLGTPLGKVNKVILNKVVPNVVSGTSKALKEAGLEIIDTIPLAYSLAVNGLTGKPIYTRSSSDKAVVAFSNVIDKLLLELFQSTPLNKKYTDGTSQGQTQVYTKPDKPAPVETKVDDYDEDDEL